jgi:hypothetical protein
MAQIHGQTLPAMLLLWAGLLFGDAPPGLVEIQAVLSSTPSATAAPTLADAQVPPTASSTPTSSPTAMPQASPTASETATDTSSATPSAFPDGSSYPSPTASATPSPEPLPMPALRINEVAWAGTLASAFDEWIELANLGDESVALDGWRLGDGADIDIALVGSIPGHGYFLLERTDDSTVSDVSAHQIYTGGLSNAGEALALVDPDGRTAGTANHQGGAWPAGEAASRASMGRIGGDDLPGNWRTSSSAGSAHDAFGQPILGSPRAANTFVAPVPTPSATASLTPSPTSAASPSPAPVSSLLINEVAWSGSRASASDEWMELLNTSAFAVVLDGWRLTDGGNVDIALSGVLAPGAYFLLERTDDSTVSDILADQLYTGGLGNGGESLSLTDPSGLVIDTVNPDGGRWPAGDAETRFSMERRPGGSGWRTFTGYFGLGHDADGRAIRGTPRGPNSLGFPVPTPTWIPGALVINEVLPRPHYDWEGTGGVSVSDEFIELYNRGPGDVFLKGWMLDDAKGTGSRPHDLPSVTLEAGESLALLRSKIHIGLNDGGDTVRLLDPDGDVVDQITYLRVRAYNLSYGRLPDGSNHFAYGLWPTPGESNLLFVEPAAVPAPPLPAPYNCPGGGVPWPRLARQALRPSEVRLWWFWGLGICR